VQVVEAATGRATRIFESFDQAAFETWFDGDEVVVVSYGAAAGPVRQRFDLAGSPVASPTPAAGCTQSEGTARVGGREYPGVNCGPISPDGRWMTYQVDAGEVTLPSGYSMPKWDQWLVNLETGETRELQAGLVHCGGCDWRWGVSWSPNSRYLAFAELGGEDRTFLAEVATGSARLLGHGTRLDDRPSWSPDGNRIVYRVDSHPAVLARVEHLASGVEEDLPIPWPAAFDVSGTYLYSPSWARDPKGAALTPRPTTIVDAATLQAVATLPGVPIPYGIDRWPRVITRSADGYVAALQAAPGCEGTAIYREGSAQPQCVVGGRAGIVSPDGDFVAVARRTGVTGPAHGPGFETVEIDLYDVDVIDVETGAVRTVVRDAPSFVPPHMAWNEAGSHLLVLWPRTAGL
jgi:dipeptidyl aminopeptidase/acylaminoacyl peptidase